MSKNSLNSIVVKMSKIRQRNYEYDPAIFLRCHSKTDRDIADVKTQVSMSFYEVNHICTTYINEAFSLQVWQACFEPSSKSKTVATCGGNQICLIDVKSQIIDQRYTADTR